MTDVKRVLAVGAALGEGPCWIDGVLWFVDIKSRHIHRFDPAAAGEAAHRRWDAPDQVGWVLPRVGGGLMVGLKTGLHGFDPATGAFTAIVAPEPDRPGNRLNDACVDPHGRLWFGSMDDSERSPSGRLYRADTGGVVPVADGIVITNGPAVSPDGQTLYDNDTRAGTIHASRIGEDGMLHDRRVLARIDSRDGHPDGPTVDAEGHVWVGLYGGWGVRRYAPDGTLVKTVRFPVANITKIAFGGPDLRTAYATTAGQKLSDADRAAQPFAGDVFAFDAGVAGLPCPAIGAVGTRVYA